MSRTEQSVMPDPRELIVAWESGRAYERGLIADVLDDVKYAIYPLPRYTRDERIRQRLDLFERCATAVRKQIAAELAGAPRHPWGCS